MTFEILDKMVGLTVMNAVDGNIIGVSTRLIFGRRRLNFKYVLVEGGEEDNRLLYLQYPDILRVNEKAILCLTDENSFVNNYVYYNDPDAFVLVGNEAVDENGKFVGKITSALLDEDAQVISFTVRQGRGRLVLDIDRLVAINQSGIIIVHRTPEDVFIPDEEPKKESRRKEEKKPAEEKPPVAADESKESEKAEIKSPFGESGGVQEVINKVDPPSAKQETAPAEPVIPSPPRDQGAGSGDLDIQWGKSSETHSEESTSAPADFGDDSHTKGKKKMSGKGEKPPKREKKADRAEMSSGGGSLAENLAATFRATDAISGLRYALLVVFFVACYVLGK